MADKRGARRAIRRLEEIKTWQLVILLVMASFVSATFLRLNNIGMIERRDAVINADKEGDEGALERRVYDLQRYVVAHMNADPGRIALEHSYKRAYEAAWKEFESKSASRSTTRSLKSAKSVTPEPRLAAGGDFMLRPTRATSAASMTNGRSTRPLRRLISNLRRLPLRHIIRHLCRRSGHRTWLAGHWW